MIVVGGEVLVDLVPAPGTCDAGGLLMPRWGGGPYNTAVALGRLGAPVRFLSRISTDPFGQIMLARLAEGGVDTALLQSGPEPSSLAVVSLAADGSATYGFHLTGTADAAVVDPGPLPDDTRAVALGTCSLMVDPPASVYERVLHREADAGRLIALDPNIRPALVPDDDAYRARFQGWLPSVGLLKVSDEDAAWLARGEPHSDWLRAGVSAVVTTRGAAGLTVHAPAGVIEAPAAPTQVIDTIGAGDTVFAALLARLDAHGALSRDGLESLDADGWADVLRFAAAAAARTCSRAGAEPPTAAELDYPSVSETVHRPTPR